MITVKGKDGLGNSWQETFPPTATCICGGEARVAFVTHEIGDEDSFIHDLHENKPDEMWVHDVVAVAVYLCKKCLKPVAIMNQA